MVLENSQQPEPSIIGLVWEPRMQLFECVCPETRNTETDTQILRQKTFEQEPKGQPGCARIRHDLACIQLGILRGNIHRYTNIRKDIQIYRQSAVNALIITAAGLQGLCPCEGCFYGGYLKYKVFLRHGMFCKLIDKYRYHRCYKNRKISFLCIDILQST